VILLQGVISNTVPAVPAVFVQIVGGPEPGNGGRISGVLVGVKNARG
jgi:hypothetical protein